MPQTNLKTKTTKGLLWGFLNSGTTELLGLVLGVVLARCLTPRDYGIVGVLTVFILIGNNLQSCGFVSGLCNLKTPSKEDYNSVFWFNITVSLIIYATLFFCAPLIARFFHTPELLWLSRFIFLCIPISAVSIVSYAHLFIGVKVKRIAVVNVVALVLSGSIGVVLAIKGFSYWALAWQSVTLTAINSIGRVLAAPFRPLLHFSLSPIKRIFSYSVKMMLTGVLASLSQQVLTFIFGRVFPMTTVGNYSQANKWNNMATNLMQSTVAQVAQPVLTEVRDDKERSVRVLRKMVRFAAFLSFPAMFGLALVANEFIIVAIGEKWVASASLLRILAVGGSVLPLYALFQNVIFSHGRSGIYLCLNFVQILMQVVIVLLLFPYGMEWIVLGTALFTLCYLLVWFVAAKGVVDTYRIGNFLMDIVPFALTAAVVMAVTYFVTIQITLLPILLAIRILIAVVLYILILYIAKAQILHECMDFAKEKFRKRK